MNHVPAQRITAERAVRAEELAPPESRGAGSDSGWEAAGFTSARLPFARFCADTRLVQSWQRLDAEASLPTQGHAFASALSDTLLAGAEIEVFFVRDGNGIAALLPLCRGTGAFARWRMIGADELCEPGDALCRDGMTARPLAEAIVTDSRALDLDRIPAGSPLIPALQAAMHGKGWVSVRPATATPIINLTACWKDPASRFNSGRRSDFRRAERRAGDFGRVSFEIASPRPDEFDALFDEAIAVEARSWKAQAGTAIALDQVKERFFREFFRSACERGECRIAFMRIDGQAVAMQMALECLDRYWLFKIGLDEKFGRCSPGTLLMLHTIGWAANRGLRAYELLGEVEPWIAQLWTRDQQDCVRLRTYPYNIRGAVAFVADAVAWLRKRALRRKK